MHARTSPIRLEAGPVGAFWLNRQLAQHPAHMSPYAGVCVRT